MIYGYEQLSLAGHAWVLKVATYGSNGQVRKRKDKKQSYARGKTGNGWDKLPLRSDSITKQNQSIHEYKKIVHTGASP